MHDDILDQEDEAEAGTEEKDAELCHEKQGTNAAKPFYRTEPSVYAIHWPDTTKIKLGFSDQTTTRFLNIGRIIGRHPKVLMVAPGTFKLEKKLHKTFDPWRLPPDDFGKEWFDFGAKILAVAELFERLHADDRLYRMFAGNLGRPWDIVRTELEKVGTKHE